MTKLCTQIAAEKDQAEFTKLVEELNELLEKKDCRFPSASKLVKPNQEHDH